MADYEGAKESAHKDVEVLTSAYYVNFTSKNDVINGLTNF